MDIKNSFPRNVIECVRGSPIGGPRHPTVADGAVGSRRLPSLCKLYAICLPISPDFYICGSVGGLDLQPTNMEDTMINLTGFEGNNVLFELHMDDIAYKLRIMDSH